MDEEEPGEEQGAVDEVEADGGWAQVRQERGEGDGGDDDSGEEGAAVAVVEEVAGFEFG